MVLVQGTSKVLSTVLEMQRSENDSYRAVARYKIRDVTTIPLTHFDARASRLF